MGRDAVGDIRERGIVRAGAASGLAPWTRTSGPVSVGEGRGAEARTT
jgi:hypothetical protein